MIDIKKTVRSVGLLYVLMIPLGLFGILYLPSSVFVEGNIAETIKNILANEFIFRASMFTSLVLQVCHIFIVMMLYKILKVVNKNLAMYMVIFMLVSVPISMLNELNHIAVLFLTKTGGKENLISLFILLHENGIFISSIFWGLWLLPMGYLVYKSNFIPKFFGIALLVAFVGYMADSVMVLLFPEITIHIGDYLGWGEILFPLWLLIKGINVEKWKDRNLQ